MVRAFRCLFGDHDGSAAVEAAIFVPIFVLLTLGITDLGTGMYVRMAANSAAQAGAAYAIVNKCGSSCLSNIQTAMNDATGNASFCSGTVCGASMGACAADAATTCIVISVSYPFIPLLPQPVYSWAESMTVSSTVIVRIL